MFHLYTAGDTVHNGFNFYRLSDPYSFGFLFRYGKKIPLTNFGSKLFWFRYSKRHKIWVIKVDRPNL